MKIAMISDLHSNIEALNRTLDHIAARGIDDIVCLGDVVGYGPNPIEVIDIVKEKCRYTIMGNHDEAMIKGPTGFSTLARGAIEWTKSAMKVTLFNRDEMQVRWDYLENLPTRHEEEDFLFVHGSPREPTTEYIFEAEAAHGPSEKWGQIFGAVPRALFVGHTHLPCVIEDDLKAFKASDIDHKYKLGDKKAIINVGSIGQPRDGDSRSCYVEFDGSTVTFHRVPYDFKLTKEKIEAIPELDNRLGARLVEGY